MGALSRSPVGAGRAQAAGNNLGNWIDFHGSLALRPHPPAPSPSMERGSAVGRGFWLWGETDVHREDAKGAKVFLVLVLASRARECTGSGADGKPGAHHEETMGAKGESETA